MRRPLPRNRAPAAGPAATRVSIQSPNERDEWPRNHHAFLEPANWIYLSSKRMHEATNQSIGIQLLGDDHRDGGVGSLAHLDLGHDDGHVALLVDRRSCRHAAALGTARRLGSHGYQVRVRYRSVRRLYWIPHRIKDPFESLTRCSRMEAIWSWSASTSPRSRCCSERAHRPGQGAAPTWLSWLNWVAVKKPECPENDNRIASPSEPEARGDCWGGRVALAALRGTRAWAACRSSSWAVRLRGFERQLLRYLKDRNRSWASCGHSKRRNALY
jgi:hypothetical protein